MLARLHSFWLQFHLLDDLRNDIRFALRNLRKHRLLSATVVITMGFGLGLNTGVFTLINASLFRAHIDGDPQNFFRVYAQYSDRFAQGLVSPPDYQALLAGTKSIRELAAWDDVWTAPSALVVLMILGMMCVPRADRGSNKDRIFIRGHGVAHIGRNEQETANRVRLEVLKVGGLAEADFQYALYDCNPCVVGMGVKVMVSRRNERGVSERLPGHIASAFSTDHLVPSESVFCHSMF